MTGRCSPIVYGALLAVFGFFSTNASGEPAWKQESVTSDGIAVHSREVPNSTVREIKATVEVDAPPLVVLDTACDPATFKKSTGKYVVENADYRTSNQNVWHNYQMVKFPVVSLRDYTLRYERVVDAQRLIYRLMWSASDDHGPRPKEGVVRVTLAQGQIDVEPVDEGRRSRLRYTLLADPGGNIPIWVINLANRVSLPNIIREIREESLRRTGRQAR